MWFFFWIVIIFVVVTTLLKQKTLNNTSQHLKELYKIKIPNKINLNKTRMLKYYLRSQIKVVD